MSRRFASIVTGASLLLCSGAYAQGYAITSSTIDGGGGTLAGTTYSLSGTAGQPDDKTLAAGTYSLSGGFWVTTDGVPGCPCEYDGVPGIDVIDLLAFLADWFAFDLAADFNGSNTVNVIDLLGFLGCWFPATAGDPCP